jgi:L-ascorbate metabolism protein UlaG (beta-lactamase superfamily)
VSLLPQGRRSTPALTTDAPITDVRSKHTTKYLLSGAAIGGGLAASGMALIKIADRAFSAPWYRGPVTDHFDGDRFHSPSPMKQHTFYDFIRWQIKRKPGYWDKWTQSEPGESPPERVEGSGLRVTYVNHATALIQMAGLNLLTDPVWSYRVSPVKWLGPRRHRDPGIAFKDLPPIDAVLISHNHYDHLDLPTLRRLARAHRPQFITGLGNRLLLEPSGVRNSIELDWWQSVDLSSETRVTCVPAQHFSARALSDRDRTLWCGFVIQGAAGTVYFSGDTAMGPHFELIQKQFGDIRLALLPIGAYLPRWFMKPVHISPADAVAVHKLLGASTSVAIHFGTFRLADDGQYEPLAALGYALAREGEPGPRFWVLAFGEGRDIPGLATLPDD